MKIFDVFLKDGVSGNVFLKDKMTNDIFLNDRITNKDLTIDALVSREVFPFVERFLIFCKMGEIKIFAVIRGTSSAVLTSALEKLRKTTYALAKTRMMLAAKVAPSINKVVRAKGLAFTIGFNLADALSEVFAKGKSDAYIHTAELANVLSKKSLQNMDLLNYIAAAIQDKAFLKKWLSVEGKFYLTAAIVEAWKKYLSLHDAEMRLSCAANVGLVRYRLLNEMDGLTLADFDTADLNDADVIENF